MRRRRDGVRVHDLSYVLLRYCLNLCNNPHILFKPGTSTYHQFGVHACSKYAILEPQTLPSTAPWYASCCLPAQPALSRESNKCRNSSELLFGHATLSSPYLTGHYPAPPPPSRPTAAFSFPVLPSSLLFFRQPSTTHIPCFRTL